MENGRCLRDRYLRIKIISGSGFRVGRGNGEFCVEVISLGNGSEVLRLHWCCAMFVHCSGKGLPDWLCDVGLANGLFWKHRFGVSQSRERKVTGGGDGGRGPAAAERSRSNLPVEVIDHDRFGLGWCAQGQFNPSPYLLLPEVRIVTRIRKFKRYCDTRRGPNLGVVILLQLFSMGCENANKSTRVRTFGGFFRERSADSIHVSRFAGQNPRAPAAGNERQCRWRGHCRRNRPEMAKTRSEAPVGKVLTARRCY